MQSPCAPSSGNQSSGNLWWAILIPIIAIIIVWLISIPGSKNMPAIYRDLKVPFRLPNNFFSYGWIIMYVVFGVAWGYTIYRLGMRDVVSIGILLLAMNVVWTYLFSAKQYIWALIPLFLTLALLIVSLAYLYGMRLWFPFFLLLAYFAWLCLATYQSFYVALYN